MNASILISSLKYVQYRFTNLCRLSTWIYGSLIDFNYSDAKFKNALDSIDFDIIRHLIYLIQDQTILEDYIYLFLKGCNDRVDIVKIIYDSGCRYKIEEIFSFCCENKIDDLNLYLINSSLINIDMSKLLMVISYDNYEVTKVLLSKFELDPVTINKSFEHIVNYHYGNYRYNQRFIKRFLKYDVDPDIIIKNLLFYPNFYNDSLLEYVYSKNKMLELLKESIKNSKLYLVTSILEKYKNINIRTNDLILIKHTVKKQIIIESLLRYDFKTTIIDVHNDPEAKEIYLKYERFYS